MIDRWLASVYTTTHEPRPHPPLEAARGAISGARYNLDGDYFGIAVNRAYYAFFYAFFYAASGLLLIHGVERSKHSGVLSEFRRLFVKTGVFPIRVSDIYGQAFSLRSITDYNMLGRADETDAHRIVESAEEFVEECASYLRREISL